MRYKKIAWTNGMNLYSEYLNKESEFAEEHLFNLLEYEFSSNNYGIIDLKINNVSLSSGLIVIEKLQCILPDGTFIDYNKEYPLSFSIEGFSTQLGAGSKFFLLKDGSFQMNDSIRNSIDELIPIRYQIPKLRISNIMENNIGFPFIEVLLKGGSFFQTKYLGPRVKVNKFINNDSSYIFQSLESLLTFLKNFTFSLKDRLAVDNSIENVLLLQTLYNVTGLLQSFILNPTTPFELYKLLFQIISIISWKNSLPRILPFEMNDWENNCLHLIELCYNIISGTSENYKSSSFKFENNSFVIEINSFGKEDILLIIQPNDQNIKEWIIHTPICSEPFVEKIKEKRISGVKREIVSSEKDMIVVKLDRESEYLSENSKLFLLNGSVVSIASLNLSIKI
jgi:hypothetical protein